MKPWVAGLMGGGSVLVGAKRRAERKANEGLSVVGKLQGLSGVRRTARKVLATEPVGFALVAQSCS